MKTFVPAVFVLLGLFAADASAQRRPGTGFLYYEGGIVRTLVPPAASPQSGRDPLFVVINPSNPQQQLGIAGSAPGQPGYHGGHWQVYHVTWLNPNDPRPVLTSAGAVMAFAGAGRVSVIRQPHLDFRCPIQP